MQKFFFSTTSRHNFIEDSNTKAATVADNEKRGSCSMVFVAQDLSKPNTDALAMEEHGNEMRVTKRGRKIDESVEEGRREGKHRPTSLPLKRSSS